MPSGNDIWSNDRYSDLLLPDPDGERAPLLDNTPVSNFYHNGKQIPCITGYTEHECVMACLEMLAVFYNVHFVEMY